MVLIEYRTYIPRGYGLIGFIIISFLYEELAARARENHATTEYLQTSRALQLQNAGKVRPFLQQTFVSTCSAYMPYHHISLLASPPI